MAPIVRYGLLTEEDNKNEHFHDLYTIDELQEMAKIRTTAYQKRVASSYNKNVHVRSSQVGS